MISLAHDIHIIGGGLAGSEAAWQLADGWDKCDLRMIPLAGHALSEPGISEALVRVMDGLRRG